jgi:hypothetical protein
VTDRRPSVLIVAAKWWSTSARLAIALVRDGCRVGAVYPAGHPLKCISGIEYTRRYRGIRSLDCLRRCIREWQPDLVIPCDDGVVAQLHELHSQEPTLRELIERSIGAPEGYAVVDSRFQLLNAAASLNIRVPRTVRVTRVQDLVDWHRNNEGISVLKVDGESGGNGVRVSRSLDQSLAAWRELSMRPTAAHAWKRLVVDRDPLATWVRSNRRGREVTIQEYIVGRPANSMLACRDGAVISQTSALVIASDGPTGAATIIRPMSDRSMALAGELLAAKLHLSGFCGLDFMIEAVTGNPYLIEMNPRCTQLGHLEFAGHGSLVAALYADLKGEPMRFPTHPVRPGPISLFPQAFTKIAAQCPHLDSSYHDIPWEEPHLVHELMLEPWPERRWGARLYHLVRPVERLVPVEFETAGTSSNNQRHRAVS